MTEEEEYFADEIKRVRGLDFPRLGMKVEALGAIGKIVGLNHSANLSIQFEEGGIKYSCHPTYRMKYFDENDNLIADYTNN